MKHIVVTGGTCGVGLAIAKDLAGAGHQVIIIGRNHDRARVAKTAIQGDVTVVLGDLATASGRAAVIAGILEKFERIDVLIHSAGIVPQTAKENVENNLLAHYFLTMGLQNHLIDARVLIVTGAPLALKLAPISENQTHSLSRAAWLLTHKTLLMYLLADQLKHNHTTVNSFFPGGVQSQLMPYTARLHNTSAPVGQYLAVQPNLDGMTATFFDQNGDVIQLNPNRYNSQQAKKILGQYIDNLEKNGR